MVKFVRLEMDQCSIGYRCQFAMLILQVLFPVALTPKVRYQRLSVDLPTQRVASNHCSQRVTALRVTALRVTALRVTALRVTALRVTALRVTALRVTVLRVTVLRVTVTSIM